jgi:hypothetical protein
VTDWKFENRDGVLAVSDIAGPGPGPKGPCRIVTLWRDVGRLQNFTLTGRISWTSEGGPRSMQSLYLRLTDNRGTVVAEAGYHDAWVDHTATRDSVIAGKRCNLKPNTLPASGSATLTVLRSGGRVQVGWDGKVIHSGQVTTPVSRLQVVFSHFAYAGSGKTSTFGTETLHELRLVPWVDPKALPSPAGKTVPEP